MSKALVILFVGNIFISLPAFANDDEKLCRGTLFERLPEWVIEHDAWWECNVSFHEQQVEYGRCLGAVRECERQLSRKSKKRRKTYIAFAENPGILSYTFPQHPTEDRFNNVEAAHGEVVACQIQLGSDVIPEVLRCSAWLQWCQSI